MGDLVRRRRDLVPSAPGAFTAASRLLAPTIRDAPRAEAWHHEAWAHRRTTGEVRFAELWLANSMAQGKLIAAYRPDPKADPVPIEDGPAADLMAALGAGPGGVAALNSAFATQLLTPGVAYLIGEPGIEAADSWSVVSAQQIRLSARRDQESNLPLYELKEGEDAYDWRVLPAGSLPVKVWRPDPELNYRSSSPVQGALPILRELSLLTQHVEAQATSRLAGAGILAMDAALEFEGGWETWIAELLSTIVKPIHDRSVPAAVAPFPVKFPLKPGEKIGDKIAHLMFATPFDEQSLKLRAEAIGRLATAMDMPTRMLLGESENHWGDWHTSDQGIKLHVEPDLQLVCEGVTRGYLTPGLKAVGEGQFLDDPGMGRVIQLRDAPPPLYEGHEVFAWYDTSALSQKPDVSDHALTAYDRFEATGDTLRREGGLDDVAPDGSELSRQVWLAMLKTDMAPLALLKLGMATEEELKIVVSSAPAVPPPGAPVDDEGPGQEVEDEEPAVDGPPDRDSEPNRPTTPPGPPQQREAAGAELALVAACDGLVHRALERSGNRLRQAMRKSTGRPPDCAAVVAHTVCNASAVVPLDQLLDGAWDRVPEVAAMLGLDASTLQAELDGYVRQLVRTKHAHSWQLLAGFLSGRAEDVAA
jgi:hypothetical protein